MKIIDTMRVGGLSNENYDIDGKTIVVLGIHVDVELDPSRGGKGTRTDFKKLESDLVASQIAHLEFPFFGEVELVEMATKSKTHFVVRSIKPAKPLSKSI